MNLTNLLADELSSRTLPCGGFSEMPGGDYRPDATAWAILALDRRPVEERVERARLRLASDQAKDGRVSLSPEHPDAFWPTPLAILAWQGAPGYLSACSAAVAFLWKASGTHWPRQADSPRAHDSAIRGWPWVADTYAWVEPTSPAVIALRAAGQQSHPRVAEAIRLLLDRRVSSGGWNYGNSTIFGSALRPIPEMTGLALQALSGHTRHDDIGPGLEYLEAAVKELRTPFSLAWGLLGLAACNRRPADAERQITECLRRQAVYGDYATSHLSLLSLAAQAEGGLLKLLS